MSKKIIIGSEGQGYWAQPFVDYVLRIAFGKDCEVKWDRTKKPDLIVRTKNLNNEKELHYKVPYISWSGEPFRAPLKGYPALCSLNTFAPENANDFYLPFGWFRARGYGENLRQFTNTSRTTMIGACFSKQIPKRVQFFKMLRSRFGNKVQGFGKICNTINRRIPGTFHHDELMKLYSNCKFVFAMENCIKKGYMTEKIINAYICGAVPIFWGDKNIAKKYFNPKTFICLNDYKNDKECADAIERISENEDLWKEMVSAPIFVDEDAKRMFGEYYDNPAKEHLRIAEFLKQKL